MNTANHVSPEDLALFALQLLSDEELKEAVDHMQHCEQCRTEVGHIQGDLVAYAMSAEMASPPAAARERLMRRVSKEKKLIPVERIAEPVLAPRSSQVFEMSSREDVVPQRGSGVLAWTGWAVAAGLLVAGGLQFHQRQVLQGQYNTASAKINQLTTDSAKARMAMEALTDAGAVQLVLHPPHAKDAPAETYKPSAHAAYDPTKGALVFVASNLGPLQPYKTYELWVLPSEPGRDPIPAGTFKPDASGNASVVMPEIPKGVAAKGFGVTIEDDGGTKAPTMSTITLVGLGL